ESGIDTAGMHPEAGFPTTVKTRIIARSQQVVRVDRERAGPLRAENTASAISQVDRRIDEIDAIVVADYGKGFVTQALADHLCEIARRRGKILAVDPHPHTSVSWRGATAVKPNQIGRASCRER